MKVKVQNAQLKSLLEIYSRLSLVDFNSPKEALAHLDDTEKIEGKYKLTEKFRESLVKKYKLDGDKKDDKEANVKANEEYIKMLLEEITIDLNKISKEVVEQLTVPLHIKLLKELKLYDDKLVES